MTRVTQDPPGTAAATQPSAARVGLARYGGLVGRHADFRRLWTGESISLIGDQISVFVLPTLAILTLHATAFEVGVLNSVSYVAYPVTGALAGVFVERVRRRPVMVTADGARLLAFASIPIAASLGLLSLPQLYVVAGVAAVFAVLFDVANQAHLATLLPLDELSAGNTGLELSRSAAQSVGPALGGLLVQAAGAVGALAVNALSFLASALGILALRTPEPPPAPTPGATSVRRQLAEGWTQVWHHPLLRSLIITAAVRNLGMVMVKTVLLLYAYQALRLSAGATGAVLSIGAVATVLGALASRRAAARLGLGPALIASAALEGAIWALAPLSLLGAPTAALTIVALCASPWLPVWNANVLTLRQTLTPPHLQARVYATARTINSSTLPLGALAGGTLAGTCAHTLGTRPGLALALSLSGTIAASSACWILRSRVRGLRVMPTAGAAGGGRDGS